MERANEQSTAYVTATFRDKAGASTPTAMSDRIDYGWPPGRRSATTRRLRRRLARSRLLAGRTADNAIVLEVTAAQGTALAEAQSGRQYYDIYATLPNTHVVVLTKQAPMVVG